ncbi:hypothetical protein J4573_12300 [Actinomadura barringtoniae]|uniref:Uncharacterized protein n=1 Tax=Actinomadura barringtoniae TaxID=1427535 RepID=A0A939T1M2_9ACTN|nr:hypothetical protein [Actinomadura barringtoniae]MBO2447876.1 hypothetical protein [Actinomadura barringtoniae]
MTDYPVALAVEDFVPVALTATGIALLGGYADARLGARAGRLTRVAACSVGAGGLAKAGWKLIVALDGPDVRWLYHALFPLLAIGFTLLAQALWDRLPPYLSAGSLVAALAVSAVIADTWPAMVLTIAAVTVCAVRLLLLARGDRDRAGAWLFGIWLAGQYVLGPLAARPDQSVALQWIEQACNTLTQGAFAYAAWRLSRSPRSQTAKEAVTA